MDSGSDNGGDDVQDPIAVLISTVNDCFSVLNETCHGVFQLASSSWEFLKVGRELVTVGQARAQTEKELVMFTQNISYSLEFIGQLLSGVTHGMDTVQVELVGESPGAGAVPEGVRTGPLGQRPESGVTGVSEDSGQVGGLERVPEVDGENVDMTLQ